MIRPVPIPIEKNSDLENRMKRYLQDKVRAIRSGLEPIHNKVVKWRRNFEARPAEEIREFPFHNASNLVVPIIAIHSNTLLARVMSAVVKTQPPWSTRVVAGQQDAALVGLGPALEEFLGYVAFEPRELDLYRTYHEWAGETIRYGTSILKVPWVVDSEDYLVQGIEGGSNQYQSRTIYSGPRPEKIPFTDFGIAPTEKTVESADFKYHVIRLKKETLEYRKQKKIYDPQAVADILSHPDRTSPRHVQQQMEQDSGAKTQSGYGWAEWDIYECWFKFWLGAYYVKCIVWYHEKTNTILRAYHSYYPSDPFIAGRLFYRDDNFHGYGFCEMLEPITQELSELHNGRIDNQTVCNAKFFRVDPDSKLHEGYRIYPSCMVPAAAGELEVFDMGQPNQIALEAERLTLELGEKLTGVSGPMHGSGSGFNTKRGVYTAMGTLSILQEGNTRTDLNITDMRYAVTKLGRLLCELYDMGGIGDRKAAFGEKGELVEKALKAMSSGQLIIPVSASTSSVNREVEKQNDIMLSGLMMRHYGQVTQMLQAMADPRISDNQRQYIWDSIQGADLLMKSVLRHFGQDEVDKLVPKALPPSPQGGGQGAPPGALPSGPGGVAIQ